jgi:hypothetical protein
LKIAAVLGLCVVGAVVAALLLWPRDHTPDPPLPAVASVQFDTTGLDRALGDQAASLRSGAVTDALNGGNVDALLAQDPLDVSLDELSVQGVTLRDVQIHRAGQSATASALVRPADLEQAAPVDVSDLEWDAGASGPGELVFHAKASALGFDVPVTLKIRIDGGRLVASPEGLPLDDIVLFDDPRVRVTSIEAGQEGDQLRVRVGATIP